MQQLCEKNNLVPFDIINFCNHRGYSFELVKEKKTFKCNLLKDEVLKKEGSIKYNTWSKAYTESYAKLFSKIQETLTKYNKQKQ